MTVSTNKISRRNLLKFTAAGAVVAGLPRLRAWAHAANAARPGIALQLYSIRDDCAKDFDRALEAVAKMGFEAVEFAGYHSYAGNAKGLRKRLDTLGLKVAGTHIGTDQLAADSLPKTIEFHKTLGCKYLIVPGDGRFVDPVKSKELADIFNRAAVELKKVGMFTGYHNHTGEFQKDGDKSYWELFAERTTADVVLQQDVGWTVAAGVDPVAMVRKYPGRSQIIHCKPTVVGDKGKAYIGQDAVPWAAVFQACEEVGGTLWYTVEQETYPDGKSALECTQISLAGIQKILAR
ncbi:MAG: sugar phosphate isomerase/epimerase family protein [Pirellulaceae bacterium]